MPPCWRASPPPAPRSRGKFLLAPPRLAPRRGPCAPPPALRPRGGGTQRLARLVGRGKALEMVLTGEPVDAQEALRIGLVSAVAPRDKLAAGAEGTRAP